MYSFYYILLDSNVKLQKYD
uniref:Uncharacterized protein n=1 Tax=Arundo donax TaxID=35708 RepID=A0A0A9E6L2_ARUDO